MPSEALNKGTVIFNRSLSARVGQSTPLENVKGIGPVMASQLRQAGIPDLETLLRTPGERLVQITGFDIEIVRKEVQSRGATPATVGEPPKEEPPKKQPPKRTAKPRKKKS